MEYNPLHIAAEPPNAHDRAFEHLAVAQARNLRLQQSGLRELICPPNPWEILLVLFCASGPLSVSEIASQLDSSPRLLRRWLDALVERHLVIRDAETTRATLTRFGMALIEDSLSTR